MSEPEEKVSDNQAVAEKLAEEPPKAVQRAAPPDESIAALIPAWFTSTTNRLRVTTELALAEARLAAMSLALIVLFASLASVFVLSAWGLALAGIVKLLLTFGIPLWVVLASLGVLHLFASFILWRKAMALTENFEFPATAEQFKIARGSNREAD